MVKHYNERINLDSRCWLLFNGSMANMSKSIKVKTTIKSNSSATVTYNSIANAKSYMHHNQSVGRILRSSQTSFPSALTATEPQTYQFGVKLKEAVLTTFDLGYWSEDEDKVFAFLKDNELVYEFSRKRGLIDSRETFLSSHALWLADDNTRHYFMLAFPQYEYATDAD